MNEAQTVIIETVPNKRKHAAITERMKDIISLEIGENESGKYWLGILNALKNRGLKDVIIICADGFQLNYIA